MKYQFLYPCDIVFLFMAAVLLMTPHTKSSSLIALGSEEYAVLGL